ncbi:MAG: hypothetical protein ACF8NJ_07340 [Phycisphaerales bacterium JB038]
MSQYDAGNTRWLEFDEEQLPKTSGLAVGSLICGLGGVLICLPFVFPVLGLILGAAAFAVMTGSSRPLRGGKLAAMGLAFSCLFLLVHAYGAMFVYRWVQQPMHGAQTMLLALDQGDYDAAYGMLAPDTAQEVDRDDLKELARQLRERYGALQEVRLDFTGNALTYPLPGGGNMLGFESGGDFPPLPIELQFEKGALQAAVKAELNRQKRGPSDSEVRVQWLVFLEPEVGVTTFPIGHMPRSVAMQLNNESWYTCRDRDRTPEEYQRALLQAEQACAIEPSGTYLNTLGVAQYRMALYPEALATLEKADQLNGGIPEDIAFLVMLHHRLGDEAQAQRQMQRLRQVMTQRRRLADPEAKAFLEEAEKLLRE